MPSVVTQIFMTPSASAQMQPREQVELVAGKGIVGDRYYFCQGTHSHRGDGLDRHLTIMAEEQLFYLQAVCGLTLQATDYRRNVMVHGLDVNALVGKTFKVGEIECLGMRLCEPCRYLEELTGIKLIKDMVGYGGLRVQVLSSGILKVGDLVHTV